MIRKHEKPLEQTFCKSNILNISLNSIEYLKEYNSGPLLDECTGSQFKIVIKNNIKTKIKSLSDCYIGFIYNGSLSIFKIVNICIKKIDKSKVFIAKQFKHIQPFYKTPINSLKLGIGTVNEFYKPLITIDIEKNEYSKYLILNNTQVDTFNKYLYIFIMITQSRLYLNFGFAKTMVRRPGQKKKKMFINLLKNTVY
ncbi:hypothetical protein AGLY_015585 [Aphis glycines]|uniref:Uncharacterized protein n=1 Tax=Aphis glycines TaxID=307491 RepID=A0A6G0T0L0_APHGL|nr:hypothetical protein AGLY_015585 [Aphis glycines]